MKNNSEFTGNLNNLPNNINPCIKTHLEIGNICDPHAQTVYGIKYLQFKNRQRRLSFFTKLDQKSLVKLSKNKKR